MPGEPMAFLEPRSPFAWQKNACDMVLPVGRYGTAAGTGNGANYLIDFEATMLS